MIAKLSQRSISQSVSHPPKVSIPDTLKNRRGAHVYLPSSLPVTRRRRGSKLSQGGVGLNVLKEEDGGGDGLEGRRRSSRCRSSRRATSSWSSAESKGKSFSPASCTPLCEAQPAQSRTAGADGISWCTCCCRRLPGTRRPGVGTQLTRRSLWNDPTGK